MAHAVLITTITTMVLISIHPFVLRKIFLVAAALLSLSSALCFADPLFMTSQYAPSSDQALSVRARIATQTNRDELSLNWQSIERSVGLSDDTTIAFPTSFGEIGHEIEPALLAISVAAFSETPVCWLPRVANLALATPGHGAGR